MLEEKMFAFAMLGSEWVLWLLVLLSAACVTVAIERTLFIRQNRTPLDKLQRALSGFLEGDSQNAFSTNLKNLSGIEASVLQSGLSAHQRGGHAAAENAIAGQIVFERTRLDRGIIIIGTTGSNAPFLGLFGTVLGIIKAFADLATQTDEGAASVMAGISEALVATAIGLLVAIPAVVLYNYLRQRNKTILSNLQSMSHLMLARLDEKNSSHTTTKTEA